MDSLNFRFEEENFTRLALSKKERNSLRQINTPGTIGGDLLSFRSLDDFGDGPKDPAQGKKRKRPKSKGKIKGYIKRFYNDIF